MFSLSHLAVVAVVVAVMMLAWKLERRKPKGNPSASFTARPPSLRRQLLKGATLVVLIAGALTPAFWTDETARYVHMVCTTGLAVLAGLWMFRSNGK